MAMFGKVRRMRFREGLSIKEIVRRTSLSRNTIRKWLRVPQGTEPRYEWSASRNISQYDLERAPDSKNGRYTVAVKVIDIFGNDTMVLIPVTIG